MFGWVFDTEEERDKFELLYNRYKRMMQYIAEGFVNNPQVAEDLTQEAFITIANWLNKIGDINDKKTRNFLITVIKSKCIDYLRKEKKELNYITEVDDDEWGFHDAVPPIEHLIHEEAYETLKKEITKLNPNYRIVMELRYVQDFDDTEIAKLLGLSLKNVEMRLFRAKRKLRAVIGREDLI